MTHTNYECHYPIASGSWWTGNRTEGFIFLCSQMLTQQHLLPSSCSNHHGYPSECTVPKLWANPFFWCFFCKFFFPQQWQVDALVKNIKCISLCLFKNICRKNRHMEGKLEEKDCLLEQLCWSLDLTHHVWKCWDFNRTWTLTLPQP